MTFESIKKHYAIESFVLIPSLTIAILALFTNFFETAFQQLVNFKDFVIRTSLTGWTSTTNHFSKTYDPEWNYAYWELGVCVFIFLVSVYLFVDEYVKEKNESIFDVDVFFILFMLISTSLLVVTIVVPGFWTWLIVVLVKIVLFIVTIIVVLTLGAFLSDN
jgi:hypothetical protein